MENQLRLVGNNIPSPSYSYCRVGSRDERLANGGIRTRYFVAFGNPVGVYDETGVTYRDPDTESLQDPRSHGIRSTSIKIAGFQRGGGIAHRINNGLGITPKFGEEDRANVRDGKLLSAHMRSLTPNEFATLCNLVSALQNRDPLKLVA